jgi:type IV secretory pathway TraG/TraD family ATPase VirD4
MIGPTGVGKTTALTNMSGHDIAVGDSALVIDPRGDYTQDVLNRIPEHRWDDVIVLDPSHTVRPVGFNILNFGGGEHERELVVDHVVHVFSDLFRSSWGPRTADVLRAGLLTLTSSKAPDGSRFTLCELPELLTNPALRRHVLKQKSIAAGVRPFWAWYENLSDAEQAQVIGPVLNKLRAFTLKTSLRLMLGQPDGLDLGTLFRERRIVLVPLSRGIIGAEAAQLVGALLLSSFWQTTLKQQHIPAAKRQPVWAYIDEFQDVLRLPLDLADMLAQARSLGVGLTLAHQHLGQLPDAVKTAVRSTARTHITFQLGYDDAKDLARFFSPLTPPELMGLARYEIAMKPCVDNQVLSPVTGITAPLPDPTTDGAALAAASFQRYGVPREDVEAGLAARINTSGEIQIGRSPRGGETDV